MKSLWKCQDWACGIEYLVDLVLGNVKCPFCGKVGILLMVQKA